MKVILYRSNSIILPADSYLRLDSLVRSLGFCYLFSNRQETVTDTQQSLLGLIHSLFSDPSLFLLPDHLKETFINGLAVKIETQNLVWQEYQDSFVGGEELAKLLRQEIIASSESATDDNTAVTVELLETLEVGEHQKTLSDVEEELVAYLLYATAEEGSLEPGTVVQTRYWLKEILTKKGERQVWVATDLSSPNQATEVILRFIPKQEFQNREQELLKVVRKWKGPTRLKHDQIVPPLEIDRFGPYLFIVVTHLPGTPLEILINRHPNGLPFKEATPIIERLRDIFTYAHEQGIQRLDIRPANLFYDEEHQILKFVDLGLLGKDCYKSYETLEDKSIPDVRDDIYALACIIYEILSGKHPFQKKLITDAMIEKLTSQSSPSPITGLRTDQFHALLQGLEFVKNKRPATVREWVEKILSRSWLELFKDALHLASETAIFMGAIGVGLHIWAWWVVWHTPLSAVMQPQIDPILTKAEQALRKGQNEIAIQWAERARRIYEERPGLINLAKENFERLEEIQTAIGEVERARRYANEEVERAKRDAKIRPLIEDAERKLKENQFDAASELVKQAKQLDEKNFRVLEMVKKIEEATKPKLPESPASPPSSPKPPAKKDKKPGR